MLLTLALTASLAAAQTPAPPSHDSDGDGIPDAEEDANHNGVVDEGESDPSKVDTDGDNVPDDVERRMGSDPRDAADVPPIPEPLYFDLVRNLGSERGELEMNVLAATSFRRSPAVTWGPEIEWVPTRGFGVELEVPMTDAAVEAIKPSAQISALSFASRRLEIGFLGSHEQRVQSVASLSSLTAVSVVRFTSRVQGMTIVGPTLATAQGRRPAAGAVLSPSLFYQRSRSFTVGVELQSRFTAGQPSTQLVLPQVHLNPDRHVKVQVGVGASNDGDGTLRPFSAVRVCWEN
ncbi:MAG: hypothetical protein KF819_11455 [Labilithrix sp.]|nr:hypothetical protein [Labilithrix sp.]